MANMHLRETSFRSAWADLGCFRLYQCSLIAPRREATMKSRDLRPNHKWPKSLRSSADNNSILF